MFLKFSPEKKHTFLFLFYGNFVSLKPVNIGITAIPDFHFSSLPSNLIFFVFVADVEKIAVVAVIDFANLNVDIIDTIVDLASGTVEISSNVMSVCCLQYFKEHMYGTSISDFHITGAIITCSVSIYFVSFQF